MKHTLLILILILSTIPAVAQDADEEDEEVDYIQMQVDSILSLITPNTPDSTKARLYCEIACETDKPDTALKYSQLSLNLSKDSDIKLIAENNMYISWAYYMKDEDRKSLSFSFKAVELYESIGDKALVAQNYVSIAKRYHTLSIYDSIFYYFDKALEIYIELKDSSLISYTYTSIGNINSNLGFHKSAHEYYKKALNIALLAKDAPHMADAYLHLGYQEDDMNLAKDYLKKAIFLFDSTQTKNPYYIELKYHAYQYLARVYINLANESSDKTYADSCLYYLKKVGTRELDLGEYGNYMTTQICYADYLCFNGKYQDALKILQSAKRYVDDVECDKKTFTEYYEKLTEIYKKIGDFKNALAASDSMYKYQLYYTNDSTLNVIANFKTEQATKIHEEETKRLKAEQKQMRTAIFSLIGGLVLVSLLVFYIVRMLNIKRKANRELTEKNNQLDQQKSEILAQRDEITAQRDEIATQKEIITQQWQEVEEVNKKLVSSINYAQRIQTAAISLQSEVDAMFPENFVYYKPRDIVSGDYYRVASCGKYRVLITADCTGHGIPGAFLSMLGISALKEYCVTENDAATPGVILDHMREFIKTTLVSSTKKTIDDGMDMTICSYDFDAMEMRYAAANQSAYIIRRGEAIRLKGDRMPVGRYIIDDQHFATHIQSIEHGDIIYTFSDGIQDQPGGMDDNPLGRKFLTKNLVKLLTEIAQKPLSEQRDIIDNTITKWRNGRPQVDDITMIGLRIQ